MKLKGVVAEVEEGQNVSVGRNKAYEPYCHIWGILTFSSLGRLPCDARETSISSRRRAFAAVGIDDAEGGCRTQFDESGNEEGSVWVHDMGT